MLVLQNVGYVHPDKNVLFRNINLTIHKQTKIALIGNNGAGKSTLLKIMAGILKASSGTVEASTLPYYIPQIFGQFNDFTLGNALGVAKKLNALKEILNGEANEFNLAQLEEDWSIEERCREALNKWNLNDLDLTQKMESLSGGQKIKIFLAGISIHQPRIILMDEPSNHLDVKSRQMLYVLIETSSSTFVVVTHDRKLLNQLHSVYELSKRGITFYGGNYDFYVEQKLLESQGLQQDIKSKEKALRKAKEVEKETMERQHKLDARGKKKQEKSGLPTISMKTLKNQAEKSTARAKDIHSEKTGHIYNELNALRKELPDMDKMKFDFADSDLHRGKILITVKAMNFAYEGKWLWQKNIDLVITSGERLSLSGSNGSGKTTLIKLLLGEAEPGTGSVQRAISRSVYIDQDYSLIENSQTVYEQAQEFNATALQEHEIKIRLSRFLFTKDFWDKPCSTLSGGEKMRLILCCMNIKNQAPEILILDEPTNNLDIQNIEILTKVINNYQGTVIAVSHDEKFLEQIRIIKKTDMDNFNSD